jgi:single-strand DNA-binding protein
MLKLQIIGNLGKDAELRKSPTGGEFLTFNVGVNSYTEKKEKNTVWVSVSTNSVKLLDYLKKGTKVYVEGYMTIKLFTTQNSETKALINVSASTIQLLGSKSEQQLATKIEEPTDLPF